jgi:hypothetical protein
MKVHYRFTVRALAIVVTVVCAYFGAWEATNKYVATQNQPAMRVFRDGRFHALDARAPFPFVVIRDEYRAFDNSQLPTGRSAYYFWFFGYEVPLPYEQNHGPVLLPLPPGGFR